jgi:hypothetical protein
MLLLMLSAAKPLSAIISYPYEGGGDACIVQLKDDKVVRITIDVD